MKRSCDPNQIATAWFARNNNKSPDQVNDATDWVKINAKINLQPLIDALADIYGTGFALGTDIAKDVLTAGKTGIDWDKWKPGDSVVSRLVGSKNGLRVLLDRAKLTVTGINDTTMNRIGRTLAASIGGGETVTETAKNINSILNDPSRSLIIASTEMTRAASVASMNAYNDAGVGQVEWVVAEGDECPDCMANAVASPVSINDSFPSGDTEPPAHPNCRCAISPIVDGTLTADEFDALFEARDSIELSLNADVVKEFDESEHPRDEHGRFTDGYDKLTIRQKKIYDLAKSTGTVDAAKTIHLAARGDIDEASVADDLELNKVTVADCVAVSNHIAEVSQNALIKDGFPEQFSVWRAGSLDSGVVSVTTRTGGIAMFGTPVEYKVNRADVLTYGEGWLGQAQTFAENELHVASDDLQPIIDNKFDESEHPRDEHGRFAEAGSTPNNPDLHILSNASQEKTKDEIISNLAPIGGDLKPEYGDSVAAYQKTATCDALNSYLRSGIWPEYGEVDEEGALAIAADLDDAIDQSRLNDSIVVFRGVSDKRDDDLMTVGTTITDKGFLSTTTSPEVASNFLSYPTVDRELGVRVYNGSIVRLEVPAGNPALYTDTAGDWLYRESEVLLPRDTTFEITGVSWAKLKDNDSPVRVISARVEPRTTSTKSLNKEFDESEHPRDSHGRFTDGETIELMGDSGPVTLTKTNPNVTIPDYEVAARLYLKTSQAFNEPLRWDDPAAYMIQGDYATEWENTDEFNKEVGNLSAAINAYQLTEPTEVYRGMDMSAEGLEIGTQFTDKGFVSTSLSQSVAEGFAGIGNGGVLMRIQLPEGTPALHIQTAVQQMNPNNVTAAAIDTAQNEQELLLDRDSKFEVIDKTVPEDESLPTILDVRLVR